MTIIIDFDALKVAELYLHTLLSRATGHITGQHEVNLNATTLMPQYKSRLEKWATLHTPTPVVAPTPAEPQVSVSMKQMEADNNADLQRRVNKARAIQRLEEYAKNVGLADTQANADLIRKWVEASGGVWTVQIVDAAVQELNNQLE